MFKSERIKSVYDFVDFKLFVTLSEEEMELFLSTFVDNLKTFLLIAVQISDILLTTLFLALSRQI